MRMFCLSSSGFRRTTYGIFPLLKVLIAFPVRGSNPKQANKGQKEEKRRTWQIERTPIAFPVRGPNPKQANKGQEEEKRTLDNLKGLQ